MAKAPDIISFKKLEWLIMQSLMNQYQKLPDGALIDELNGSTRGDGLRLHRRYYSSSPTVWDRIESPGVKEPQF